MRRVACAICSSRQRRYSAAPERMVTASAVSGKPRSLGSRERLKSDGIGLAMGRIRRTRELTPWIRSGLVAVCNALFASRLAPTFEMHSHCGSEPAREGDPTGAKHLY